MASKSFGKNINRRLASWTKGVIAEALDSVSSRRGSTVVLVNPAYTSQSGQPGTVHVRGKPAGIAAASPGGLGGLRSLQHTRQYLANLGFLVVPEQMGVGQAGQAFTDGGELRDEDVRKGVEGVGAAVARLAMAVRGG